MFSNKYFGWKLAAALAVVALLGVRSGTLGDSIHPNLWRCLAQPARWDGTPLWFSRVRVVASDAAGFEIDVQGARARVVPAAPVAPGDSVSLTGTFRAAGPLLELKELRKEPAVAGTRRLPEAVSIAVLALTILNLLRHFAFRPKVIQVEGRD